MKITKLNTRKIIPAILIIGLAAGYILGNGIHTPIRAQVAGPGLLPKTIKSTNHITDDSIYEKISLFWEALAEIQDHYVEEPDNTKLLYGAIRGMCDSLDPHTTFLDPDQYREMRVTTHGSFGGLGIEISIKDKILTVISPIEDTPAFKAGIQAGDMIIRIDGKDIYGISINEAVKLLRGPRGSKVVLSIKRKTRKKLLTIPVIRAIIKIKSVKWHELDDHIGYIRITEFSETTAKDLDKALDDLEGKLVQGICLDLRYNPGGLLISSREVSNRFLPGGKVVVYTQGRHQSKKTSLKTNNDSYRCTLPMVVLINGGSASASEIVSGALKDYKRAVIVGTKSYGKGSVQTIYELKDQSALKLTTQKFYTPLGHVIHGKGVMPDVVVKMPEFSDEEIKALSELTIEERIKKDPQVEEAVKQMHILINKNRKKKKK